MNKGIVRTRIAPSPTGYPHIGTIYQALFDYGYAKKHNGQFLVRIEDTDRERFVPGAEEVIRSSFDWFGLNPDESPWTGGAVGPYRQSERKEMGIYQKYADELIEKGYAYYCFCTKERLESIRKQQQETHVALVMYDKHCRNIPKDEAQERKDKGETCVIRMKIPENTIIRVQDGIRGEIEFDSTTIDDQVLLKSDGFPTYHLAVVVDDHLMNITHVVRGEEWITSFPKHKLLYDFFEWEMPEFFHTPVLRNPDKSKLSKRHGHTSVEWYKNEGFLPEALLNFLALMGWSNPQDKDKEVFSLDEFIQELELKDLRPVGPIFDLKKLEWMNGIYIREKISLEELKKRINEFYKDDDVVLRFIDENKDTIDLIIGLAQTRMKTLKDFKDLISEPETTPEFSDEDKNVAGILAEEFEQISSWTKEAIMEVFMRLKNEKNVSLKTLYLILLGKPQGLPLADFIATQNKDDVIKKIKSI